MIKQKLEQYAALKASIKELEANAKELSAEIAADMAAEDAQVVKTGFGSFTLKPYRKWTYPSDVEELRGILDKAETEAQQRGTATCETTYSLSFTGKKHDDKKD